MQVSFALFADAANLSQEGKLNILGVFDALQVAGLPTVHPRAHLVVHLKGSALDRGTHEMALRWLSPTGQELWSTSGELGVGDLPSGVLEIDLPVIAQVDLPLDQGGVFAMRVEVDGTLAAEVPVHVRGMNGAQMQQKGQNPLLS